MGSVPFKSKEKKEVGGNNAAGNDFKQENEDELEVIEVSSTDSYTNGSEAQSSEMQLAYNEVKSENHTAQDENVVAGAENISEYELPANINVSYEELPGPTRAELSADTEVVAELPTVNNGAKRKSSDYVPGSSSTESEVPAQKQSMDPDSLKEIAEKPSNPKKLPELEKYWKAVNDDPTDFTGWTYLLQYVDQEHENEDELEIIEVSSTDSYSNDSEAQSSEMQCKNEVKSENHTAQDDAMNVVPGAENISEDELPANINVSYEELPGPTRAELSADTEVMAELPTVKNGAKRKSSDYVPGSSSSESEVPAKKQSMDPDSLKQKAEKPSNPKKLPELEKYWKALNDDPTDFTGWTYLLQYVDQEHENEDELEIIEVSSTDSYSNDSEAQSSEMQCKNEVKSENHTAQDDAMNVVPGAENISEDELPANINVSYEELPGPTRAELSADTEVVAELPTVKNGAKRKSSDYVPGSSSSESEVPAKKQSLDPDSLKEKAEKPKKSPEFDKYWKAVNDDPTDFTSWTYLLQYVDKENDMEAAREAYDAFLSRYPYCYNYWCKYADYEKRKGNKTKCEKVFERGLKTIPLSVDLWIHYLTYVKSTRTHDEDFVRGQFDWALYACGLDFRSDPLWGIYINWETEGKRLQNVTKIYDMLLATPTQRYKKHFKDFQEHIWTNPPNETLEKAEFLALSQEVRRPKRKMLRYNVMLEPVDNPNIPPGDDWESRKTTEAIRERIVSIRRKIHKKTANAVNARWNFERRIKRPHFHVKPLERYQLYNWEKYLDYEIAQGDRTRIVVLFERCLIACASYEEFWLKYVHYLEGLQDPGLQQKIEDVYKRAFTILNKPSRLHLKWDALLRCPFRFSWPAVLGLSVLPAGNRLWSVDMFRT